MDPTFTTIFESPGCMLSNLQACIDCIANLHNQGHKFTDDEFNLFITRCIYKKTKSAIASDTTGKLNLNQTLTIMFTHNNLTQYQLNVFIACCKNHKTTPGWVQIFFNHCYLANLNLTKLSNLHVTAAQIATEKAKVKYTPKYVLGVLKQIIDSYDDDNENMDIWKRLPKSDINVGLLNDVIVMGNDDYTHHMIICEMLNEITPDDKTFELLVDMEHGDHQIIHQLLKYNIINDHMVMMLSNRYVPDIVSLLNPKYNIITNINWFNIIIDTFDTTQYNHQQESELKDMYTDEHVKYSLIDDNIDPSQKLFSVCKFWEYMNLQPNGQTFMISCKHCYIDLVNLLINKYHMIPTIEHLNIAISLNKNEIDEPETRYKTVAAILLCKVVPDKTSYQELVYDRYAYDLDILGLLIKFGLVLDFEDVKYALEKGILIDDLGRFGIDYDERLYFELFVNRITINHDTRKKFKMDQNVLTLRDMCGKPKMTFDKVKQFTHKNNILIDRYCLDYAAMSHNNGLMYDLLEHIKIPLPTTFILFTDARNKIYMDTIQFYKIDHLYMAKPYDIAF